MKEILKKIPLQSKIAILVAVLIVIIAQVFTREFTLQYLEDGGEHLKLTEKIPIFLVY